MLNLSSCSAFPSKVLSFSFFFSLHNSLANQFKHCSSPVYLHFVAASLFFSLLSQTFTISFSWSNLCWSSCVEYLFVFFLTLLTIYFIKQICNKKVLIIIIVYPWRIWWDPVRVKVFLTLVNFPSFKPLNASFALWKHVFTNCNEELRNQLYSSWLFHVS